MKQNRIVVLLLVVTAGIYLQMLNFPHISWDDPEMVFRNQDVRSGDVPGVFSNHYVGNYIPVTMAGHIAAYALSGDNTWGHHFLNLLLHLVNGLLVYLTGRKLFGNAVVALAGAAVFLLHPLQVESVAWISELKNCMFTMFYTGALLTFIMYVQANRKTWYFVTVALHVLACMSKPSAVTLPLVLPVLLLPLEGLISRARVMELLPLLLVSAVAGYVNLQTQTADQFINHSHMFPLYQRLMLAGTALANYLLLGVLPARLSVIYPFPDVNALTLMTGLIMIIALVVLTVRLYRKRNFRTLAALLFIPLNLLPVLQLIPFGEALYADRYLYVALAGAGWLVGLAVISHEKYAVALILTIGALLGTLTFLRVQKWQNALVLYEDIVKKFPHSFVALNSLGVECMYKGSDRKAEEYLDRAIKAAPKNFKAYYNKGLLYLKNAKTGEAIRYFSRVLEMEPYAKAYAGRAAAYLVEGDLLRAKDDALAARRLDPANAKAHYVLGNCFNKENRLDEALEAFNTCISIDDTDPEFFYSRAIVLGKKQRFAACLEDLERVIAMKPDFYDAYYWRAVGKANVGQDPCPDLRFAARHGSEIASKTLLKYCK